MPDGEITNVGALLISEALPPELRKNAYKLDKKGIHELFTILAEKYPDKYKEVFDRLSQVGKTAAWTEGVSVNLSSLRSSKAKQGVFATLKPKIDAVINDDTLTDDQREAAITGILAPEQNKLTDTIYKESEDEDSPYILQLKSGARGKKSDLGSIRGADLLATDQNDNFIPVPLWNSYSEGFTPAQYFAASYGQRKGQVGVKLATADAGYLTKRVSGASHRILVTRDTPPETRLPVGLPTSVADKDNIGAVLAKDAGKFKAGTLLTADHLSDLKDDGVEDILVHSAMTEPSEDGGVSRFAAGRRTRAGLSQVGDNVGLMAAQSIGERLSQLSLGSKHAAGVNEKISKQGMEYINRILDAPEHFPEAGPLVDEAGIVNSIVKAPQGGTNITVGKTPYYIPDGLTPIVKEGDHVDYGDDLSDGIPHPAQLIKMRGMGEARRVYMAHLGEALANSGAATHRRNLEPVVTGLLNWATVNNPDGIGDNMYGDIVPFNRLTYNYKPRSDAKEIDLNDMSDGKYLEEPALHYTPGTRITKKARKELKKWGINKAIAHELPPSFDPIMNRSMLSVYHDPDWRVKLMGFYTSSAFQKALQRGAESDTVSTSFVPALAKPKTMGDSLTTLGKYGESH